MLAENHNMRELSRNISSLTDLLVTPKILETFENYCLGKTCYISKIQHLSLILTDTAHGHCFIYQEPNICRFLDY